MAPFSTLYRIDLELTQMDYRGAWEVGNTLRNFFLSPYNYALMLASYFLKQIK